MHIHTTTTDGDARGDGLTISVCHRANPAVKTSAAASHTSRADAFRSRRVAPESVPHPGDSQGGRIGASTSRASSASSRVASRERLAARLSAHSAHSARLRASSSHARRALPPSRRLEQAIIKAVTAVKGAEITPDKVRVDRTRRRLSRGTSARLAVDPSSLLRPTRRPSTDENHDPRDVVPSHPSRPSLASIRSSSDSARPWTDSRSLPVTRTRTWTSPSRRSKRAAAAAAAAASERRDRSIVRRPDRIEEDRMAAARRVATATLASLRARSLAPFSTRVPFASMATTTTTTPTEKHQLVTVELISDTM